VLLAKVNALLCRSSAASFESVSAGKITLHTTAHKVYHDGQEITLTHKEYVLTDKRRMEQVLDNLIVSAKKNVHPDGVLRLELTENSGALHFSIFNQGRLIPGHDLPKIWTKFYRDINAGYSGSGLGLSIVAQILSMQGLPYGAENLADGVRFTFSIPVTE